MGIWYAFLDPGLRSGAMTSASRMMLSMSFMGLNVSLCVHFFLITQEYTITTTTAAHNRFITLMINAIQHILIRVDLHVIH